MGALGSVAAHEDMIPTRLDSRSSRAGRPEYSAGSGEPRAGTLAPCPAALAAQTPNAPQGTLHAPPALRSLVSIIFATGSRGVYRGVVTLTVLSVVVLRARKVPSSVAVSRSHARNETKPRSVTRRHDEPIGQDDRVLGEEGQPGEGKEFTLSHEGCRPTHW